MRVGVLVSLFLIGIANGNCWAQSQNDIIETVGKYPKLIRSPQKLADLIQRDFSKEELRVNALYTWMALNITYDLKLLAEGPKRVTINSFEEYHNEVTVSTLKARRAICNGYSITFSTICDLMGIENSIITGFSMLNPNDIGIVKTQPSHAWNAVNVNDEWQLLDVTWGAGYVEMSNNPKYIHKLNMNYLFMDPDLFFYKHFPEDEKWKLTKGTRSNFFNQPIIYSSFYDSGIEFKDIPNGIIKTKGDVVIQIKNTSDSQKIIFKYDGNSNLAKFEMIENNGEFIFTIEPPERKEDLLLMIYDRMPVAIYKVTVEN